MTRRETCCGASVKSGLSRRRVLAALLPVLGAAACGGGAVEIPKAQAAAIGSFQLRVMDVSFSQAGQSALRKYVGKYQIAVQLRCQGGNRFSRMELRDRMFKKEAVGLQGADGERANLISLASSEGHETWTATFYMVNRDGLRLLLKNPQRADGQPGAYSIPL